MAKLLRINRLSNKSVQDIIDSVDTVLFDLDGVLWHNTVVIPGSDDAIKKLRSLGKNIGFITNNTIFSLASLTKHLTPFGAKVDEVITPNLSLVQYLKRHNFQKDIYVIGPKALKTHLIDAGYKLIEYKDVWSGELEETGTAIKKLSFKALEVCKNVGAIVLDSEVNHCFGSVVVAQVIARQIEGIEVLSGLCDDLAPLGDNVYYIGAQYLTDSIERWSGKSAIKVGKPSQYLADTINTKYNILDPSRVLVVGDNVETDIVFGIDAGYQTCLVLSGIWTNDQVEQWNDPDDWKPNYVADRFGDFLSKMKNM